MNKLDSLSSLSFGLGLKGGFKAPQTFLNPARQFPVPSESILTLIARTPYNQSPYPRFVPPKNTLTLEDGTNGLFDQEERARLQTHLTVSTTQQLELSSYLLASFLTETTLN